ncbi:polysaccharide deacetylase family protein [Devosia sp.]|uniref:polysaccharide deacetylase family protein n=1 Tax=Devosia sp. TaxID=1871048 RepID=UPI0032635F25
MRLVPLLLLLLASTLPASANDLLEPVLHIAKGGSGHPQVALTLDACGGATDLRIIDTLIDNEIPATLFLTRKWMLANPDVVRTLVAYPQLFELEDHGAEHVPAVLGSETVYGIKPAGTLEAIAAEIKGGADALVASAAPAPHWYRDATAEYSPAALPLISSMGLGVAGFSLNADYGASVFAPKAQSQMISAHDGDVIIAHMNQPKRPSGQGIAAGILALKAKGFRFVRLEDVQTIGADGRS